MTRCISGLVLLLVACSGPGDTGSGSTATQGTNSGTDTTSTASAGSTTGVSETTGSETGGTSKTTGVGTTADVTGITGEGTTEGTTGSTSAGTTGSTSEGTTTGGEACVEPPFDPDPKGRGGEPCATDDECAPDQRCFVVPLLGGLCGECKVDADCPGGGCTLPNPLAGVGAVCNTGKPGAGCESDAACESVCNNHCGLALDAAPIIQVSTCGECKTSEDCSGEAICTPKIDILNFTGVNACASPGSLDDGASCSLEPGADVACSSGICAAAVVMNVIKVGVCSECDEDEDCGPGESCKDAYVDVDTGELNAAVCQ